MSLISPIVCGTEYSFLNILKKIIKKDTDGNYYLQTVGLASDEIAPAIVSAEILNANENLIILTYSEDLDPASVPAAGDYTAVGVHWASVPSAVAIVGNEVRITLNGWGAYYCDTITISYTPGVNPLRDLIGNTAVALVNYPVTNNVAPCAEYTAVVAAMTTIPNAVDFCRQHTFMKELVDTGFYAGLDIFYLYANHTNTNGEALLNWKLPGTYNASAFNSPVYTAYEGFLGNTTTRYINSGGWIPSVNGLNFAKDSCSQIIYVRTDVAGLTSNIGHGANVNADTFDCFINPRRNNDNAYFKSNDATLGGIANTNGSGFYVNTRTAANAKSLYKNGLNLITSVTASTGRPTVEPYVLAYNDDGARAGWRADQVSFVAYGKGFLLADVQLLTGIIERYMDAYGKGVIP